MNKLLMTCFALVLSLSACKEKAKELVKQDNLSNLINTCKAQLDSIKPVGVIFTYDEVLMSKIITDMGSAAYHPDSALIECSSQKGITSIKSDFMVDVLNMAMDSNLDDFLKAYCTQMDDAKIQKKYRAVYYYLAIDQLGMGENYKNTRFIKADNYNPNSSVQAQNTSSQFNAGGCLEGSEIRAEGTIILQSGKPPAGYEIHYLSTSDAKPIIVAKGLAFNPDGSFKFKGKLPDGVPLNLHETGGDIKIVWTRGSASIYSGNCTPQ